MGSRRQNLSKLMRNNIKLKRRQAEQEQEEDIGYGGEVEMFGQTDILNDTAEEEPEKAEPESIEVIEPKVVEKTMHHASVELECEQV